MKKKSFVMSLFAVAAMASNALAVTTVDYTAAATSVTGELTPAIAAALPIGGVILAAGIGWKLFRRFTK